MTIKPVIEAVTPKYPDKYGEDMRNVLSAAKPYRWLGTPLIGALSVTIAFGLSGCVNEQYVTAGVAPMPTTTIHGEMPGDLENCDTMLFATLIPLFEFGVGTGGIGCVAIVAPVFMSEEEAFVILSETFREAGLTLHRNSETLDNINIPVTNIDGEKVDPGATLRGSLNPQGLLDGLDLPVVFVSRWDVANWHVDIDGGPRISFSGFNVKGAAQTLAENNPGMVVFYDPVVGEVNYDSLWELEREPGESDHAYGVRIDAALNELTSAALVESEQMLRLQAEAFIAWLGDNGL